MFHAFVGIRPFVLWTAPSQFDFTFQILPSRGNSHRSQPLVAWRAVCAKAGSVAAAAAGARWHLRSRQRAKDGQRMSMLRHPLQWSDDRGRSMLCSAGLCPLAAEKACKHGPRVSDGSLSKRGGRLDCCSGCRASQQVAANCCKLSRPQPLSHTPRGIAIPAGLMRSFVCHGCDGPITGCF